MFRPVLGTFCISYFFHSHNVHLDNIKYFIIQVNSQLGCYKNVKTYIKMLLHVSDSNLPDDGCKPKHVAAF